MTKGAAAPWDSPDAILRVTGTNPWAAPEDSLRLRTGSPYGPYYHLVPKSLAGNAAWRLYVVERAHVDLAFRAAILEMCKRDVLFFINTFGYCHEPRKERGGDFSPIRPFITWQNQDPVVFGIEQNLGSTDMIVVKSRAQGATWLYCAITARRMVFDRMFVAGFVSRGAAAVDTADDPSCVMWKMDWFMQQLPVWMLGEKGKAWKHTEFVIATHRQGSSTIGYPATGDMDRGGRKGHFVFDEFAAFANGEDTKALKATQAVTNCRIFVSTFQGRSNEFYEMTRKEGASVIKFVLDWKDSPPCNRGLYRVKNGEPVAVDPVNNPLPIGYAELFETEIMPYLLQYGFKVEGTTRSPWYDEECRRGGATPQSMAEEYDMDPVGSSKAYFEPEVLERIGDTIVGTVRPPWHIGRLTFDVETLRDAEFVPQSHGDLRLWFNPDASGLPPPGDYCIGCDIAYGTAGEFSSASVACVMNRRTGEQVAEWESISTEPNDFAEIAMALCHWFYNAHLIWEKNGGGGTNFTNRVIEEHYTNVYFRDPPQKYGGKKSKRPGWQSNGNAKNELFGGVNSGGFRAALMYGRCCIRSAQVIKQCAEYEFIDRKVLHQKSLKTKDPAECGENHGDHVVASALAWHVCFDAHTTARKAKAAIIPTAQQEYTALIRRAIKETQTTEPNDFVFS